MWAATVRSVTTNRSAIRRLLNPCASSAATSCSRGLSPATRWSDRLDGRSDRMVGASVVASASSTASSTAYFVRLPRPVVPGLRPTRAGAEQVTGRASRDAWAKAGHRCRRCRRAESLPRPQAERLALTAAAPRRDAKSHRVCVPRFANCDPVSMTTGDLGRWARFPVTFVRCRLDRSVDDCTLDNSRRRPRAQRPRSSSHTV
jgi:hypothetical protein